MSKNLSVVLATFNEEENLKDCLESVEKIASEIVIVDGSSTDKTIEIAKSYGAKVIVTENQAIFHINKQKAINEATKDWILQLDADERVSEKLAHEIEKVITLSEKELVLYQENLREKELFKRHIEVLEQRDGKIGTTEGGYSAFFIPRLNFFLGRYLRHGGVYPDGVIRLLKKGKAYLPAKSVHEQMVVLGRVGFLAESLNHYDSPTFARYIKRNTRYIALLTKELDAKNDAKGIIGSFNYLIVYPFVWFFSTFFLRKGFLDSWQGFIFSFFSALRFPRAYLRWKLPFLLK